MEEMETPPLVRAILIGCVVRDYAHLWEFIDFVLNYLQHREYEEPIDYEIGQKLVAISREIFDKIRKDYPDEAVVIQTTIQRIEKKIQFAEKTNEFKWICHCVEYWKNNLDEGEPAYEQMNVHSNKAAELEKELASIKRELGFSSKERKKRSAIVVMPPFSPN